MIRAEPVWLGHAVTIFSTFLGGLAVVLTRHLAGLMPAVPLAGWRFVIGAGLMIAGVLAFRPALLRVAEGERAKVATLGVLFFALFPLLFTTALRHTEAARGAMLLATMPVWSALIAHVFRLEPVGPRRVAGIVIALFGVSIILSERGLDLRPSAGAAFGDLLMLGAAICGACYGLASKRVLRATSPVTVVAWGMTLGGAVLMALAGVLGEPAGLRHLAGRDLIALLALGALGGAAATYLWTFGLARLTATQVAVYVNFNPLFATVMAVMFLDERLTSRFLIGCAVIILGVLIVNWARARARADPPSAA